MTWDGVPELMKTLNAAGVKIDDKSPEVKAIILPPAQAMIANAQNLAPVGKRKYGKYEPGNLRRALMATPGPINQRGIFLVARKRIAPYAVFVEFGTSKMSARPFFRPAMLQFASTYAAAIAPGVQGLIAKAAADSAYHPPK